MIYLFVLVFVIIGLFLIFNEVKPNVSYKLDHNVSDNNYYIRRYYNKLPFFKEVAENVTVWYLLDDKMVNGEAINDREDAEVMFNHFIKKDQIFKFKGYRFVKVIRAKNVDTWEEVYILSSKRYKGGYIGFYSTEAEAMKSVNKWVGDDFKTILE